MAALTPILDLLHRCEHGALATHSRDHPGYPYASLTPFVPDAQQRPILLISGLAEHTRNLLAEPKSSLLLTDPSADDAQAGPRLTLLGRTLPFEPNSAFMGRFLRYQPTAARLLQLADFRFFRMDVERLRFIEGFGRMGWLDAKELEAQPFLPLEHESRLLAALIPKLPAGVRALGLDPFGIDLTVDGTRRRIAVSGPLSENVLLAELAAAALLRPAT